MSIKSPKAFYPLGGIQNFRSHLEGSVRYDWDLPLPFDIYLRNAVVIFIMRIEDLHNTRTFKVVPSRDCKPRNPDDKAGDVSSISRRNYATRPRYCMYEGAVIKNESSLLVTLDYSAVPCEPQKTPQQSLATRLFRDDGFLLFKGPAGTLVPFSNEKLQASTLVSSALPRDKGPLPKDSVRTAGDPCFVDVAAPMTKSVHSVKIQKDLLRRFLPIEKVATTSNTAKLF